VPGLQIPFEGITETDPQPGWLRGTESVSVVASDLTGTRIDTYRSHKPFSSSWTLVTDKGIAVSKTVSGGDTTVISPPELVIAWPSAEFQQAWRWHEKGKGPEFDHQFEMWGPLNVSGPNGEAQGYVILQKIPNGDDPSLVAVSSETRLVPALGIVYTATVIAIPQIQTSVRVESSLQSMKRGTGTEPATSKLPD
jgi:hypothetical protein